MIAMSYVMQAIDLTNEMLNNVRTSNYADDPTYATSQIAATAAVDGAVDTLVVPLEYKFFFVPATDEATYTFQMSAAGTFYVDWGDGNVLRIDKSDTTSVPYSHEYKDGKPASAHEIALAGYPTKYAGTMTAVISFYDGNSAAKNTYQIKSMRGCLGCLFHNVPSGGCPHFYYTFANNAALTGSIPENLLGELNCPPGRRMFSSMFAGCTGLTGSIPENLFAGIKGAPEFSVFNSTFKNCSNLTGSIPEKLFAGVKGPPDSQSFASTFNGCSGLTGEIPEKLFAGVVGDPATIMFASTFSGCKNLSGDIPTGLFAGINPVGDYLSNMFSSTFDGCSGLTGESPKIDGKYLYEIWKPSSAQHTYKDVTLLDDYADIPAEWK